VADVLAGLAAASVQGQLALAGPPGARPRRFGETDNEDCVTLAPR